MGTTDGHICLCSSYIGHFSKDPRDTKELLCALGVSGVKAQVIKSLFLRDRFH